MTMAAAGGRARRRSSCASCGRRLPRTVAQADSYCSERCRRSRLSDVDRALEQTILALLRERAARAGTAQAPTICPSDAARALFTREREWRAHMERARAAARRLVAQGRLEITQRGQPVDPDHARGPIRLRLPRDL